MGRKGKHMKKRYYVKYFIGPNGIKTQYTIWDNLKNRVVCEDPDYEEIHGICAQLELKNSINNESIEKVAEGLFL